MQKSCLKRTAPLKAKSALERTTTLRKVGKRGKRLQAGDAKWRQQIYTLWGDACLLRLDGCTGQATEIAHAYSKGAHPEWCNEIWVGYPLCHWCHQNSPRSVHRHGPTAAVLREWADVHRDRGKPTIADLHRIRGRHLCGGG